MMNKIYRFLKYGISLVAIAFFVFASSIASGSQLPTDLPYIEPGLDQAGLLFGQNHYYSIYFRGNGEAIVYVKLTINNSEDKALNQVSFQVPKANITEFVAFQKKGIPYCVQYDYQSGTSQCLRYEDSFDFYSSQGEYQKVTFSKTGNYYTLTLPSPIESLKSGMVIVSYAASGYVTKQNGIFKFNFETFQVPARIQEVRVAVDVDPELELKGKKSQVNYQTDSTFSAPAGTALNSKQLDYIGTRIGNYGLLVKDAKNLAPNESYTVKGEYADNWFRLYLEAIIWTLLIIAVLFVLLYYLFKFLRNRQDKGVLVSDQPVPIDSVSILNLTNVSVGLLSAILVTALTFFVRYISMGRFFNYYYDQFFQMMILIVILMLYVLFLFGPAIFMAAKHGWRSMLSGLIAEFLWLIVFLILYFILFQTGLTPGFRNYYY